MALNSASTLCACVLVLLAALPHQSPRWQASASLVTVDTDALIGKEVRVFYNVLPPAVTLDEDGNYGGYLVDLMQSVAEQGGTCLRVAPLATRLPHPHSHPHAHLHGHDDNRQHHPPLPTRRAHSPVTFPSLTWLLSCGLTPRRIHAEDREPHLSHR